jgi:hypothetical protein
MVELFIGDYGMSVPVDLPDNGISILFNRQRTDYTNPTIVKNSFTKTIKLPGTKENDIIFSTLWKLDRVIEGTQFDIVYNPSKRVPFFLLKEGNLVEQGYVKLNNITWNGKNFDYEITLYGELGNILYGLSYRENQDGDSVPVTLGDLDFGSFDGFQITKYVILEAWRRLKTGTGSEIYDTINFAVCYDGVPKANKFDTKKVWVSAGQPNGTGADCSYGSRPCKVMWKDRAWAYNKFPYSITEDSVTYTTVDTMISRMDPNDHYGLFELKNDVTPLEVRDLRSYFLRPVIRLSKIFDAIGSYLSTNFGYTLDLSDPFFSTDEYLGTWMTLSMLYEIDPDVETGTYFSKSKLFSSTASPASYLISYCKCYGIYLDVDYVTKKLVLTRLPRFFTGDIKQLKIDEGRDIKITPLSFDKSAYIFNYAAGSGQFIKQYKDTYGVDYGIKRVNTGYKFDSSTSAYIDNNIFKQALDTIEQSIYYRYSGAVRADNLINYPQQLTDPANLPTYKLFNVTPSGEVSTTEAEMSPLMSYTFSGGGGGAVRSTIANSGYQFIDPSWIGLSKDVWQDGFPKLQFCDDSKKGVDGKDVLIRFNGFKSTQYGYLAYDTKQFWGREQMTGYEYVQYLLSDDDGATKEIIGKNAYYDNPQPDQGYGGSYIEVVQELPMFTRAQYTLDYDSDHMPVCIYKSFGTYTYGTQNATYTTSNNDYFESTVSSPSGNRDYVYININGLIKTNHKYFIASIVSSESDSYEIKLDGYDYPDIIGSTVIDHIGYDNSTSNRIVAASVVNSGSDGISLYQLAPLSVKDHSASWRTYGIFVYDLTELGLGDYITSASQGISYFGLGAYRYGYDFTLDDTLDFGVSREIYVPACIVTPNLGIYNKYWNHYISDVYSINTRVMECYCYLDNIDTVFKEFYYYDNCLWILSKITDWSMETKMCKAVFIKVNQKSNYLT